MNKIFKNKTAKGLVSLIAIIILLSSILASTLYYQNNITANVIREASIDSESKAIPTTEVNDIKELSQLNEGWYSVRNGYVFYLEHFDSAVPLYVKINNQRFWNGFLVVDADGNIEFRESFEEIAKKENTDEDVEEKSVATTITGRVTGMERVSR